MNWNASAGAASYHVYRALHTNGFYNPLVVVTTPGHVDQAVAHGGTYHYVVVAANAGGSSGDSAVISATVNGNRPGSHTFINVNFGAHLNVNGADEEIGMAATGQSTNDYWNVYSRDVNNMFDWRANGAMTGLKDADGAVTGVGLAVTNAAGFWVASLPDPMYNSYLYASGGGNVTVVVTNLPAGEYDLYLYGHGNANGQNSVFDVTIGGTSSGTLYGTQSTTTTAGWNSVNWEEGQQYVVFRGLAVTGAGQSLRITVRSGNSPFTPINGLQIKWVTPASAYADGIPAPWREQHFGTNFLANPHALATADPDGDGANNYQEFLAGSDPMDAASVKTAPVSVSTYAGSTSGGQDGFRTNATFLGPGTLTYDAAGRIWVCELTIADYVTPLFGAHRIRIIDTAGVVTTYAGSTEFGDADGPLASARFAGPTALVFDTAGNAFVLERSNHRIRKIDASGTVSTFAGSIMGFQDGMGTNAKFNMPMGLCIDRQDNLFVADFEGRRVRKVTPQGEVTTFAGGVQGYQDGDRSIARFYTPADISIGPDGTLYVADWAIGCIRTINTNGTVGTFGSGLTYIERVFVDARSNVYASVGSDGSYRKFKPDGTLDWKIQNPSGFRDGPISVAQFGHFGQTLVMSDGNLLISDGWNNRLRLITLGVPRLLTISPSESLFIDSVNVSLSTTVPNGVLRYTLDGSEPTTTAPAYAGSFTLTAAVTVKARVFVNSIPISDVLTQAFARVYALDDGIPASWREQHFGTNFLANPQALATADPDGDGANNYQEFLAGTDPLDPVSVRKVPLSVSTFAGSVAGGQDGFRTNATFHSPASLKFDSGGRLWVPEAYMTGFQTVGVGGHRIRIMGVNGVFTTFSGSDQAGLVEGPAALARYRAPNSVAFDSRGNVFVADRLNHRIRKIDTDGIVSTFAGSSAGFRDDVGPNAQFYTPIDIAVDASDNLYVTDFDNYCIRKVTPAGEVTTYAGGGGVRGFRDGNRTVALFDSPSTLTYAPDGSLFVADWAVGKVRRISPAGEVSTFASGLQYIDCVSVDGAGNVYASVGGSQKLTKFAPDATKVWSLTWTLGFADGPVGVARFSQGFGKPVFLPDGSFLVNDVGNHRIRQVTVGIPSLLTLSPSGTMFTNSVNVSLNTTVTNGVLRYTLDGSNPNLTSPLYVGAFYLNAAATVKAAVFVNNIPVSGVLTQAFARVYALNDGIPASWREQYFGAGYLTDPRVAWDADPDGDGANNLQEYVAGTNPLDPLSGFRVGIRMAPVVTWNSISNRSYRILRKDTLSATNWSVVVPSVLATNSVSTFIDVNASSPYGFYVIEVLP